jgi:hypothetical protein
VKLALELDVDHVVLGERFAGRVRAIVGGTSRTLHLNIGLYERTLQLSAAVAVDSSVIHEGDLETGRTYGFHATIPAEAPPSLKTKYSELYWELEVVSDEPGLDTRITRRIEVVSR